MDKINLTINLDDHSTTIKDSVVTRSNINSNNDNRKQAITTIAYQKDSSLHPKRKGLRGLYFVLVICVISLIFLSTIAVILVNEYYGNDGDNDDDNNNRSKKILSSVSISIESAACNHDTDGSPKFYDESNKPDIFVSIEVNGITEYTNTVKDTNSYDFNLIKDFSTSFVTDIKLGLWDEDPETNELIGEFYCDQGNVTHRTYRGDGWSITYSVNYVYNEIQ